MTVSNLVPVWEDELAVVDEPVVMDDGGGSYEPTVAAVVVEQALQVEPMPTRLVTPPERFDPTERVPRPSAYAFDDVDERADERAGGSWQRSEAPSVHDDLPAVDYDLLRRRDIAKELLRDRLVRMAEQREHRSAYEIAFILLAAAVAVLLAAPPLVQVLLAARGIQV
jgi:hypothetical protein